MSPSSDINALRSRVRALKRKLARPLAELHLQRMADELCLEWTCAQADRQPFPNSQAFIIRVAGDSDRETRSKFTPKRSGSYQVFPS